MAELEDLMNQIFARRADAVVIPYVPFSLPLSVLDYETINALRQTIHLPYSPTSYSKRRKEAGLVCGPRKSCRSAP